MWLTLMAMGGGAWVLLNRLPARLGQPIVLPAVRFSPLPSPARPYGMAPLAFEAYLKACTEAKIHPWRIGQTIGDHPLSAGYHKRDGTVKVDGQSIDYTAAVDLGTHDLNRRQIDVFLSALTRHGFAPFYREKGKWKGREHIHAIYAQLPMKRQLRGQVREFLGKRRTRGIKPLKWELKAWRTL